MKNFKVRSLNIDDAEIFEQFIQEHIVYEEEYLTDSSITQNKKYITYKNFNEWYKNKKGDTYLVFSDKTLIGAFEIHNCGDGYANIALDVRPTERNKGYEKVILNFINNICLLDNIEEVTLITSIPYLSLDKESKIDNITSYRYNVSKNKVLIKKY